MPLTIRQPEERQHPGWCHCPWLWDLRFCTSLTDITLPVTLSYIGPAAFQGCSGLTNVILPNALCDIEWWAFMYCSSLSGIIIPDLVTNIGFYAFLACDIESINIPRNVINIASDAFQSCGTLSAINVDPINATYSSVDGVLFDKSQTTLLCFPAGTSGAYTVPGNVTNIVEGAFDDCENLTSITHHRRSCKYPG